MEVVTPFFEVANISASEEGLFLGRTVQSIQSADSLHHPHSKPVFLIPSYKGSQVHLVSLDKDSVSVHVAGITPK